MIRRFVIRLAALSDLADALDGARLLAGTAHGLTPPLPRPDQPTTAEGDKNEAHAD